MTRFSLRLRIFLFFALNAAAGIAIVIVALWMGLARLEQSAPLQAFVQTGLVAGFGLLALNAGIWLLFDDNVAKPIQHIAATLRARAHAGAEVELDPAMARYLGDLAPAARAVSSVLSETALTTADRISAETARLEAEKARLTAILTDIPVATVMADPHGHIVLYDAQAAEVLAQQHVPRLGAHLADYFEPSDLNATLQRLARKGTELPAVLRGRDKRQSYDVRLRPLDGGAALLVIDAAHLDITADASRPLVFDFDLLATPLPDALGSHPLRSLTYTVLDTETTGLLPHKDDIVQIGAVRIVNGRRVPGEVIDQLVDPGRPIPPASTAVHRITNAMVAGKPDVIEAGKVLHGFARGSVLVAHNAPFDLAFLKRDAGRMGVGWDHPVLDTVLLSAVIYGTTEDHTLDALCDRLGVVVPPEHRHTACGDAVATADVLLRLIPLLEAQGLVTLGDVLAQTRQHGRLLEDVNA